MHFKTSLQLERAVSETDQESAAPSPPTGGFSRRPLRPGALKTVSDLQKSVQPPTRPSGLGERPALPSCTPSTALSLAQERPGPNRKDPPPPTPSSLSKAGMGQSLLVSLDCG